MRILGRRIERKIEDLPGENQFGFRRGKGTRDAFGVLRIISEQTLDTDEELCACCTDWQQAFDLINRTRLTHIIKKTDIVWHKLKLISKLCMDQSAEVQLDQRGQ